MRHHLHYITFILTLLSTGATGQVVDTSKNINSWKLMHNYSRFENTKLDTSLFDLHQIYNPLYRNGMAYEHVGIIGNAAQSLFFFERPATSQFLFGSALYPYLANPDRTIFYNTRTPFTELLYSNTLGVDSNDETVRFLHTQNMGPYTNFGIDFEVLAGREFYFNEETRATKFTLFGSSAKDKYSAFGTLHFNRFNNHENGGIQNPGSFRKDSLSEKWAYPVNLDKASSSYTNIQLFYTQKYAVSEKRITTDTLGITTDSGRNISFNHQLTAERNSRMYRDEFALTQIPDFYQNFYYFNDNAEDSVVHDKITNTLQIILGDPYTDKLSARIFAGYEFSRYGQRSPVIDSVFSKFDTVSYTPLTLVSLFKDTAVAVFNSNYFNDLFVGFYLAGPPEKIWYWNIDGKYYLAGYYRNSFFVNATFAREVFETYRLGLRGNIENRNVSFYHNHYSSSFFQWDNNFNPSQIIKGEAFLTNEAERFETLFSAGIITNYLFWNENAIPEQHENAIYIFSGKISKHFKVSGFNSVNQLLIQYVTAGEVLPLPLAAIKTSNYWEQEFFKGALKGQFGIDFYITSLYTGNAYMPATGVFYLQNDETIGGYPFADAFLGFQIKRARIFGSYSNGFAGILNNNYFTAAGFPTKPAFFRFGLAWTFYD